MKVVLLSDVPKVGRKYSVALVSDGFGRNYLIPRGLAEVATPAAQKRSEAILKRIGAEKKDFETRLADSVSKLDGVRIVMRANANDEGGLFAALHEGDISEAIKNSQGIEVPPEYISIDKPIKKIGDCGAEISVGGKKVSIAISVEPTPASP